MRYFLALTAVVLQIVVTEGAVNYCGARMCGHSNAHTFCKYRAGPGPSCAGYIEAALTVQEKARVLARLNRRRSEVALGWRHWPPAGDMMKLRWIDELSREAQRWADQCRPPQSPDERDVCRDLYSISVGQCVASIVGEAPGLRPESMVDMWFMQSLLYDGNITSYIPARIKNYYGDFAQMMWPRTFLVGCGRSRFMAEWRGRIRTVERLVCNFASRGPVPARPLWTPADAASMCPPRSYPDTLPGLCTYQQDYDSRSFNDSLSKEDDYLLETVFDIEKNKTLDYLGSLDELYLTKIAIATIGTPVPVIPLYYSLQKRDVIDQSEKHDEFWEVDKENEIALNTIPPHQLILAEKPVLTTKHYKTKVNTIGRPKPYDINELNDQLWEQKTKNLTAIQELRRSKEKDFYAEYGLVETEEDDVVNSTTTVGVLTQPINNDTIEVKSEINAFTEILSTTEGVTGSGNYFTNVSEEINDPLIGNKSVDDYLPDPETVRALQDALDQMERTLASPRPVSTPGKVRRELRNLEADLQNVSSAKVHEVQNRASEMKSEEVIKEAERNRSRDRGPMLSMVLRYMPYLKPYESSILGDGNSHGDAVRCVISVVVCGFLLDFLVS